MKIPDEYEIRFHFPKKLSPEIQNYATEVVFKASRYIFTWRLGKAQLGYCTHCKSTFPTEGLKHNSEALCPACQSSCKVKSTGMGRGKMIDDAYFVYYEKSLLDPNVVIARGIYAVRDYRGDYTKVETKYNVVAAYIFDHGTSMMFKRTSYYFNRFGKIRYGRWRQTKMIYSLLHSNDFAFTPGFCCRESIAAAVKGTHLQYSAWDQYYDHDLTEYFALYSKYPCVEYLTKLGFKELVTLKLRGDYTYRSVNWNGRNLLEVLRMTKQDFNEIKQKQVQVDFYFLKVFHVAKKQRWGLSLDEIIEFANTYSDYYFDIFRHAAEYSAPKKLFSYLKRQHEMNRHADLIAYRDYLNDCVNLQFDLTQQRILFPKDLYQAHQRTIRLVKVKADKDTDRRIKAIARSLQKYCFEWRGLVIRPVASFQELIDEGKALQHCVGNYAGRYADGKTEIFVIRKLSAPDKPYFTVEMRNQSLIQIRGLKNCDPDKRVASFIKEFKAAKLRKQAKAS